MFSAKSASPCLLQEWSTEGCGHQLFCFSHGLSLLPLPRDPHPLLSGCSSLKIPVFQCQRDRALGITGAQTSPVSWGTGPQQGNAPPLNHGVPALSCALGHRSLSPAQFGPEAPASHRVALFISSSLLHLSPDLSETQRPICHPLSTSPRCQISLSLNTLFSIPNIKPH